MASELWAAFQALRREPKSRICAGHPVSQCPPRTDSMCQSNYTMSKCPGSLKFVGPGPKLSPTQEKCCVVSRVELKQTRAHPAHFLGDKYKSHLTEMRAVSAGKAKGTLIFFDKVLLFSPGLPGIL